MNRLLLSIIITLCSITVQSQTFLDSLRKDEPGQGSVNVIQSPEIDKLVNGTEQPHGSTATNERPAGNHQPATVPSTQPPVGNKGQHHEHDSASSADSQYENASSSSSSSTTEETIVDTRKKVMRKSYKTRGYRIQVFSGGNSRSDRQKAETAGVVMKSNFPAEPIYVHFYSPSWKCRMGNYLTLEEARKMLVQIKKLGYRQACIVKGTISVQY